MFEEIITLQRLLENPYALTNIDELMCDFLNSNRCLLSAANSLFTQLSWLAVLQCCCTVKRFPAVTFTSHNLQNKIIPSVVKYFSPNSLTKPRNLTLSEHLTLGTVKLKLYRGAQYKASFTNSGFVRTASAVHNFYFLLFYTHKPTEQ
jgi:hypothetical protein